MPVLRLSALILLIALSGCSYIPRNVAGVPEHAPWFSIPLKPLIAEERGEPEAISACEECGAGMVAGVLRLHGKDADEAEAALRNPQALAKALIRQKGKVKVIASARRLEDGASRGFVLSLARADAVKPPVWGAALARREGESLHVFLVIGPSESEVEAAVRRIAGA
ncbi:hypothetical protein [Microvirga flavescens]|uniref:hypothetical protein n=1 Tax=Microvirga flavescens TaxID=2249811 RepID=UPI000DDC0473|nr:hypothetical protein [Microvirga flavescens]